MRAGAFGVADQILLSLANLAVGLAAARVMAPADFGVYVIAFAVSLAGGSVQLSLITDPLVILGAPRAGSEQSGYFAALLRLQLMCSGLVALAVAAVAGIFFMMWGTSSSIPAALAAVAVATLPSQMQFFTRAVFFARLQPALVLVNDLAFVIMRVGGVGLLMAWGDLTTAKAFLVTGAAAGVAFLAALPACRQILTARRDSLTETWGQHWRYGRWLLATAAAYWCSGQAPSLLVGGLLTPVAAAIMKACQFLVSPLHVLFAGLDGVLAPRAARLASTSGEAALARFLRLFGLCACGAVVIYALALLPVVSRLLEFLYAGRYTQHSLIVAVLLVEALLAASSRPFVLGLKVAGATRRIFHAHLCAAVVGLASMLVLAPRLGVLGAALAAPAASLALLLYLALGSTRTEHAALPEAMPGLKLLVLSGATFADPASRGALRQIAASGVDVTLVLPRRVIHAFAPRDAPDMPDMPEGAPGVKVTKLPVWYPHPNATHILFRGLRRLLRRVDPDVVHCVMEPWSLTCLQLYALLPALPRRPLFGLQPGESKPEHGPWLASRLRQRLYRRVLRRCDYFIGWSELVVRAARRMGLNGVPVTTGPPVGVDTDIFHPAGGAPERLLLRAEMGLGGPGLSIAGFVGRFVEEKGVRDLVAAGDLAARGSPGLRIALLGDGPLRGFLEEARRVRPWLSIHPRRDQAGVARFMRGLDALVLPSRSTSSGEEQFGLVLAEAMACDLPVIGSSCGAIPEVVGAAGRIFPEGDVPSLATALAGMAHDQHAGLAPAAHSRLRAASRYSSAAIAASIMETIQRASARAHP